MQTTPRLVPSSEAIEFSDRWLAFLEELAITYEDAEQTIRNACLAHENAATIEEIIEHFCEAYRVPLDEGGRVWDLATLAYARGRLRRTARGRLEWVGRSPRTHVLALMQIPLDRWDEMRPLVVRGRAAWIVGDALDDARASR